MPPRSTKTPNGAIDAHDAGHALAGLEAAEELVALLAPLLVEGDLLRQDEAVRLPVDLEDLQAERAADERLELLCDLLGRVARLLVPRASREVDDLADRHEAAHAEVDDQAALVVIDDAGLDDLARVEALLHRAPLALEAGPSQREDRVALRRLGLEDVDEDLVADLDLRAGLVAVSGTAPVHQLAVADDALALATEVDEDLVRIDADDGALDHVAVLEALDLVVGALHQLGHRRRLGLRLRLGRLIAADGRIAARGLIDRARPRRPRATSSGARGLGGRGLVLGRDLVIGRLRLGDGGRRLGLVGRDRLRGSRLGESRLRIGGDAVGLHRLRLLRLGRACLVASRLRGCGLLGDGHRGRAAQVICGARGRGLRVFGQLINTLLSSEVRDNR